MIVNAINWSCVCRDFSCLHSVQSLAKKLDIGDIEYARKTIFRGVSVVNYSLHARMMIEVWSVFLKHDEANSK